jgi:hypothetical protein
VTVTVEPVLTNRNRLTTALRLILAIPHAILVGGLGFGILGGVTTTSAGGVTSYSWETGLLGAVAAFLAIVSWFTLVFSGLHIPGIRQFTLVYLRWRVRVLAYMMLLEDRYPPFGDADYPASVTVDDPKLPRDRVTIALRLLVAIPHFIVLFFLCIGWWITAIIAWVLILATGAYPPGLYDFGVGILRWFTRVEAYVLLLVDEYPPFALS